MFASAEPSLSAVSSLGGFRTPASEHAAPSLKRPASETLHRLGSGDEFAESPLHHPHNELDELDRPRAKLMIYAQND